MPEECLAHSRCSGKGLWLLMWLLLFLQQLSCHCEHTLLQDVVTYPGWNVLGVPSRQYLFVQCLRSLHLGQTDLNLNLGFTIWVNCLTSKGHIFFPYEIGGNCSAHSSCCFEDKDAACEVPSSEVAHVVRDQKCQSLLEKPVLTVSKPSSAAPSTVPFFSNSYSPGT